jgi:hypothetical protein
MEAINVFGAGNPPAPIIDAVTSDNCSCMATCTRRSIAVAAASDVESYPTSTAQRLQRQPMWTASALRVHGAGARHRSVLRAERLDRPVEVSLRSVAASATNTPRPNIARSSQWIESGPAITRRSQQLPITRGASTRCCGLHALHGLPRPARPSSKHAISNATSSCLRTTAFACH